MFERAIKEAEGGLTGWLEHLNSYRVVRILSYPAAMPLAVARVGEQKLIYIWSCDDHLFCRDPSADSATCFTLDWRKTANYETQ